MGTVPYVRLLGKHALCRYMLGHVRLCLDRNRIVVDRFWNAVRKVTNVYILMFALLIT